MPASGKPPLVHAVVVIGAQGEARHLASELAARLTLAVAVGHRLPRGVDSPIRTVAAEPTRQQTLGQPGVLLKPSELALPGLMAEGLTRNSIARRLGRRPEDVRSTLRNIFGRLGVSGQAEAVAYAAREGLLGAGPARPAGRGDHIDP